MGGPCRVKKPVPNQNTVEYVTGPACTDNFQIIKFSFEGVTYYSAEQCFQALKFQAKSSVQVKIQNAVPKDKERDGAYGMRVWGLGQSRASPLRANYEAQKVKLMLLINLAKFSEHDKLQRELVEETQDFEIVGAPSTWQWSKWNGLIQMLIRSKIKGKCDLKQMVHKYAARSAKQIEAELESDEDANVEDEPEEEEVKGLDDGDEDAEEPQAQGQVQGQKKEKQQIVKAAQNENEPEPPAQNSVDGADVSNDE